eukprot:5319653-Karenia_brevis.AAC.1
MDIEIAFDSMDHDMLARSLQSRGLHPLLIRALVREIRFMEGDMAITGVAISQRFRFQRGGKQGGVETPAEFNVMVETLMQPVVASWKERGYGFKFREEDEALTHLVWADNIFIVAADLKQFSDM